MTRKSVRPERESGAVTVVENILRNKWTLHVLAQIRAGVNRPGQLVRTAEGLTTKVLNQCLGKLVRAGVLKKIAYPEKPPRVEYVLTPYAASLTTVLDAIDALKNRALGPSDAGTADNEPLTASEASLSREARLLLAVRAVHLGVWEWHIFSNRATWDAKTSELFGISEGAFAEGFCREGFFDLVHPDDRPWLQRSLTAALEANTPYSNEFRIIRPDGEVRWIANWGHVFRDNERRPLRMLGIVQDITERRAIENALRENDETFRAFAEHAREWLWEVDGQGRVTYSNPVVEEILGYRPEELRGQPLANVVHEDDQAVLQRLLEDALAQKRGWTGILVRCQHRDRSYRHLECHGLPIIDERGEVIGFRGSDRDVT